MNKIAPTAVDVTALELKITWSDGRQSNYPARLLRLSCQCATCVSEVTGRQLIEENKIAADVQITNAEPTGHYAISMAFSDHHRTGIYTYEFLYGLGG